MDNNAEIISTLTGKSKILPLIYEDLAQPGVKKIGDALGTVLEFSTAWLLPIKLLNEKFKINFKKHIDNYKAKIESIPDHDLIEVDPQIGTPVLEKLSYTTNEEIAELFLNLLVKASSIQTMNLPHPAFIRIIEQLSVDEARIIQYINNASKIKELSNSFHSLKIYISFSAEKIGANFIRIVEKNATLFSRDIDLVAAENISLYLENLINLGILENQNKLFDDRGAYQQIWDYYKNKCCKIGYGNFAQTLNFTKKQFDLKKEEGSIAVTTMALLFMKACLSNKE